ncbi:MAG: H-NS histone family protein, partial [Pseudomonadota bacterium]
MVDLEKLSLEELTELEKNVRAAIASFEKRKRNEAMAAVEAVARKHGYALAELVTGEKPTSARKPPLPPKYRHPDDPARTWSGR